MAADYYTSSYARVSDRPRRSIAMWCLDIVMTVLSAVAGPALLLTYFAPYVCDAGSWLFPVLGLAAPVTFAVTLLLAIYWIMRWRLVRFSILFLILFVGFFNVSLFWRPEPRSLGAQPQYGRSTLKIMSYNVRSFYGEDGESSVADIVQMLRDDTLDVICLQEFNAGLADKDSTYRDFVSRFKVARFDHEGNPDAAGAASMVILSRFDILRSGVVLSPHSSVWADLKFGGDTLRVVSNHLRSTNISSSDNEYITQGQYISDTAREVKIRSIVERICDNSTLRGHQADSIADFLASSPRRRIVCGDFNDTPMSYVYHTISRGLQDAFSECGSGYSYTYRGFHDLLRIDFMLASEELETLTYEVQEVGYSDHYPVMARYKKIL